MNCNVWIQPKRLVLAMTFLTIALMGGCGGCPPKATIELEDTHAASWMIMDNSYYEYDDYADVCDGGGSISSDTDAYGNCGGSYSEDYEHGILFQFGHSRVDDGLIVQIDGVNLTRSSGETISLSPAIDDSSGDFDWLDVRPKGSLCVIDPLNAYQLFIHDRTENNCDNVTLSSDTGDYVPESCLRERSLHASLKADIGIITYWTGQNLYEVIPNSNEDEDHDHVFFTFELGDEIVIDRWLDGCFQESYEDITKISIEYKAGTDAHHSEYHMSPINGGNGTVVTP